MKYNNIFKNNSFIVIFILFFIANYTTTSMNTFLTNIQLPNKKIFGGITMILAFLARNFALWRKKSELKKIITSSLTNEESITSWLIKNSQLYQIKNDNEDLLKKYIEENYNELYNDYKEEAKEFYKELPCFFLPLRRNQKVAYNKIFC